MLPVLSFKRSLFAGVLDVGEDSVFLGKSRLKKFMESVETVTGNIPQTDHEPPSVEPEIGLQGEPRPSPEKRGKPGPRPMAEPWQELLSTGAAFLQILGKGITAQKDGKPDWTSLLETDKKTGRSYLKMPLPDKKVIQSALPALNSLVDTLKTLTKP